MSDTTLDTVMESQQKFLEAKFEVIQSELKSVGTKVDSMGTKVDLVGNQVGDIKTQLAVAEEQRKHFEQTLNESKVEVQNLTVKIERDITAQTLVS